MTKAETASEIFAYDQTTYVGTAGTRCEALRLPANRNNNNHLKATVVTVI